MLCVAVARSSSGSIAIISRVLPVCFVDDIMFSHNGPIMARHVWWLIWNMASISRDSNQTLLHDKTSPVYLSWAAHQGAKSAIYASVVVRVVPVRWRCEWCVWSAGWTTAPTDRRGCYMSAVCRRRRSARRAPDWTSNEDRSASRSRCDGTVSPAPRQPAQYHSLFTRFTKKYKQKLPNVSIKLSNGVRLPCFLAKK